jgi:tetratricopeptide (TPR) repeat protein
LAHHFEQAGLAEKAVAYLRQAGEQAYHISANQEAIELLTRALALLTALQSTQRRSEQELALRITLGRVLQHTKGLGSEEACDEFFRAYELCAQVGNDHDRFAVLHGLSSTSRDYQRVLAFAEQMLQIADHQPNPIYQVSAHHLMGHDLMMSGDYISARAHLEQSIALYEPRHHDDFVLLCGQDEGVAALANLGLTLWHLGYSDQALQRGQEAVALAEGLSHPMSVAIAQHFVVWIHLLRGEAQIAHQKIDALLVLASEQGFGFVLAVANTYRGQALLLEVQVDAAIEQLEQARESWRRMKLTWYEPYVLLELVVAHCRKAQFERGFVLLNKAEVTIEALHEFFVLDILYRIKGELLLAQSMIPVVDLIDIDSTLQMDEAEAAFMQSLQVARMYQAKSRELQATIGLCRLWKHQGKSEAAHSALAEIYHWFTEGFETKDLVDAKALLEELTTALSHANPQVTGGGANCA